MNLPSLPMTLKQGVGRRILGFFILAGILPVVFTAGLAYYEVGRGLETEVNRTLRQHAKDYGLDVLARLQRTNESADQLAHIIESAGVNKIADHEYLLSGIETMWIMDELQTPHFVYGASAGVVELADLTTPRIDALLPPLVTGIGRGVNQLVFLRRLDSGTGEAQILAIKPDSGYLWGPEENLPFSTSVCVFSVAGEPLHCSQSMAAGLHAQLTAGSGRLNLLPTEWQLDGSAQLAAFWQLFLVGEFNAPALDFVRVAPGDDPVVGFGHVAPHTC